MVGVGDSSPNHSMIIRKESKRQSEREEYSVQTHKITILQPGYKVDVRDAGLSWLGHPLLKGLTQEEAQTLTWREGGRVVGPAVHFTALEAPLVVCRHLPCSFNTAQGSSFPGMLFLLLSAAFILGTFCVCPVGTKPAQLPKSLRITSCEVICK